MISANICGESASLEITVFAPFFYYNLISIVILV